MSTVEYRDVTKVYRDGTRGLHGLSLAVDDGEFLVLLGPSGCGKSTALRLLAGLEDATGGDILIGGVRVNDLPPGARDLGMVFQSYALYPHMTVAQNLAFGLQRTKRRTGIGDADIAARVEDAVKLLELGPTLEKKPRELSGGQQQRVAIGRALVRRPKVLLMDEPLSNLDAKLRARMRLEIRRLHERHGTTTIYVTHDQVEAMTLSDRVAVMADGVLQQHATPLDAYERPANRFVASFLGTPPMNLFDGEVAGERFVAGELSLRLPAHLRGRDGAATFGIRAENVAIVPAGEAGAEALEATLLGREHLGSEIILHLDVRGQRLTVASHAEQAEAGQGHEFRVLLDHPKAVLFQEDM